MITSVCMSLLFFFAVGNSYANIPQDLAERTTAKIEIGANKSALIWSIGLRLARLQKDKKLKTSQKDNLFTKIAAITGQDTTVAGNLANWGSTTIETGLSINNNNGGTVAGPALQVASFTTNPAVLVTTTAGSAVAQMMSDLQQPALSLANASGTLATAPLGTRLVVNGPSAYISASGIVLSVTGIANNPALVAVGNGTTTGPALQLLNNPASTLSDFNMTIDAAGMARQSGTSIQNQFILSGGQAGPLTIGTTTATALAVLTNNAVRLSIDQNANTILTGSVAIGPLTPAIAQLQIAQGNPFVTGSIAAGAGMRTLYLQGRYAYVINQSANTLQIFDVSNPAAPFLVSTTSTVGATPDSIYVQGNYAYVVNFGANTLVVFDVKNPAAPVIVNGTGTATGSTGPSYLYVQGRYAYVTHFPGTLFQVFDIANPLQPVIVGTATTTAGLYALYVQGRYAYATNYTASNLQIFDISNPTAPTLVNVPTSTPTGTNPDGIYVQGRYAYVVNTGSSSLQIFDVYNPAAPVLVNTGGTATAANPFDIVVQGRYAYIANVGASSVQVFDVSNPVVPVLVGAVTTGATPQGICVQGRYAYIAAAGVPALQTINLGGAYIQQMEAGGLEVGSLATRENMVVNNDADIKGGVTVGRSLYIRGNIDVYASGNQNALVTANGSAAAPAYSFVNTNTATGMYSPATNQLALATAGVQRLNIDGTGSVTQQVSYKAQVYRSTATQTVTNATAAVIFNTTSLNPNGNFNTTAGSYTAPVSGIYLIAASVNFTIASATTAADVIATRTINMAIEGVNQTGYSCSYTPGYTTGATGSTAGVTGPFYLHTVGLLPLIAGQVLTINYTTTRTDTININNSHLSVHFLSF